MPSRCVAAGCSNTSSESVSVYKFPKQETLLKQWTKQVQRTRANWVPTASSTLCSEHFEADCFEETPRLMKDMGMHRFTHLKQGTKGQVNLKQSHVS
uniref:THAP-type domain-containing protein n=1 Tax=Oryzias latipes TaxID=8090 RepID=A0A3P9H2T7_ORYLA